jgi:hypothetical protein
MGVMGESLPIADITETAVSRIYFTTLLKFSQDTVGRPYRAD